MKPRTHIFQCLLAVLLPAAAVSPLPSREAALTDRVLPDAWRSRELIEAPTRTPPAVETELPSLVKDLTDNELPATV